MLTRATWRILFALAIAAQSGLGFHNLTASPDGSTLYFVSEHRLRGTAQPGHWKIFRLTDAGVELVAARDKPATYDGTLKDYYNAFGPLLDGQGRLVAYTIQNPCNASPFPVCPLTAAQVKGEDRGWGTAVWLSGDGRYLATSTRGRLRQVTDRITDLRDGTITSVTTLELRLFFTADGEIVYQASGAVLGLRGTAQRVITTETPSTNLSSLILTSHPNRAGALLHEPNQALRWFDAKDGKITEVDSRSCAGAKFADGDWFVASCGGSLWRGELFSAQSLRRLPLMTADMEEFAPARRGEVVWFRTKDGVVHKYDEAVGTRVVLSPPVSLAWPAYFSSGRLLAVPGKLLPTATASVVPLPEELAGIRVWMNGHPTPIYSIAPEELRLQVPGQIRPGPVEIVAQLPAASSSVFEWAPPSEPPEVYNLPRLLVEIAPIRHDWSDFVTPQKPARPGELVHLYGEGLGSVSEVLPNGVPAPLDRLLPLREPVECSSGERPVRVVWVGLAPGLFGIYQLTIAAIPSLGPGPEQLPITCRFASGVASHTIWVTPP